MGAHLPLWLPGCLPSLGYKRLMVIVPFKSSQPGGHKSLPIYECQVTMGRSLYATLCNNKRFLCSNASCLLCSFTACSSPEWPIHHKYLHVYPIVGVLDLSVFHFQTMIQLHHILTSLLSVFSCFPFFPFLPFLPGLHAPLMCIHFWASGQTSPSMRALFLYPLRWVSSVSNIPGSTSWVSEYFSSLKRWTEILDTVFFLDSKQNVFVQLPRQFTAQWMPPAMWQDLQVE